MESSNCNCKCDNSCDVGEYLDYTNCKCRQSVAGLLVEECSKNIDENEAIYNETLNLSLSDYKCNSCTLYIVLFIIFLVISTVISTTFIYFYWYSKKILQIFITSINENFQTSQYKKLPKLFFE